MKERFLHEIPEKRDRFTKHFQTEHKQCVAAVYPRPVHFEEEGKWKEIDNRLELKTENGKEYYGNRDSALQVRFAKEAGKGSLVILKKDGHEISWDLAGAQDAAGAMAEGKEVSKKAFRVREKEPPSGKVPGKKDIMSPEHLTEEGLYEDILPGVDISYVLNSEMLKENIILKSKEAADEEFVFEICHKDLALQPLDEEKTRYGFFEKGACIFELPQAYMFDAGESFSMKVEMKVETGKTNY